MAEPAPAVGGPHSVETSETPPTGGQRDRGRVVLLLITVLFVGSLVGPVVVIGDLIVTPRFVTAGLGLLLLVSLIRVNAQRYPVFTVVVGFRVALLGAAVLVVVVASFLLRSMDSYLFLKPSGPDGCRVVAKESSFLFAGSGEAATVGRFGIVLWEASWTADDGVTPLANSQYNLSWNGDGATLELVGDSVNPIWPGTHGLTC